MQPKAGGKPSTWLPPGGLVERSQANNQTEKSNASGARTRTTAWGCSARVDNYQKPRVPPITNSQFHTRNETEKTITKDYEATKPWPRQFAHNQTTQRANCGPVQNNNTRLHKHETRNCWNYWMDIEWKSHKHPKTIHVNNKCVVCKTLKTRYGILNTHTQIKPNSLNASRPKNRYGILNTHKDQTKFAECITNQQNKQRHAIAIVKR